MSKDPDLIVRIGTLDDLDPMMELALMGAAENGISISSPRKVLEEVYPALARKGGLMGVVGPRGGKPQGGVLLRIVEPWYTDTEVLEERAIFIHPDHRSAKGGRAARLCEFSIKVSDELGLPLMIGVLSNHRTAAKVKLYERFFGPPSGAYWFRKPGGGEVSYDTVIAGGAALTNAG